MKRKIEMTLKGDYPTGAKQAGEITLSSFYGLNWTCESGTDKTTYSFEVEYDKIDGIARQMMTVWPVSEVDFVDVDAGLHFSIRRESRMRQTGDDR